MSGPTVVVAGATGALGRKIVRGLRKSGAGVRAVVRPSSDPESVAALREIGGGAEGFETPEVDTSSVDALAAVCEGAECVVSAVAGLRPVIVDAQTTLLEAAVRAGVPRFIPSDFAIDFYRVPDGTNRNLDLRREFAARLEGKPIRATSILNGIFSEFVFAPTPFVVFPLRRSLYFGARDQAIDATAMDDVAAVTAACALDPDAPRFVRVAGNVLTPEGLAAEATAATGTTFKATRPCTLGMLRLMIRAARLASFDKSALYPAWQGMQYVENMQSGAAKLEPLDNGRFPDIRWTPLRETLKAGKPDFIA